MSKINLITYRQVGDYNIPNLLLPPKETNIKLDKLGILLAFIIFILSCLSEARILNVQPK